MYIPLLIGVILDPTGASLVGAWALLSHIINPTRRGQNRLHFDRQASLLYVYHLEPREQSRMIPLRSIRMPQDAETIAAFLPTENEGERVIVPLPPRAQGVIRIVFTQNFDDLVFNRSFDSSAGAAICGVYELPSSKGYYAMSNQWSRPSIEAWFEAPSYLLSDDHRKGMIQTITKMCVLEHDDHSLSREFLSKAFYVTVPSSWVVGLTDLLFEPVLVSSEAYESSELFRMPRIKNDDRAASEVFRESFNKFRDDFRHLQEHYQPTLKDARSSRRKKQVLILWFCHAQLLQYLRQIEHGKKMYRRRKQSQIDSRSTELLPNLMDDVITEANLFREFHCLAEEYSSALSSLLDVINSDSADAPPGCPHILRPIEAELRGLVADLRQKTKEVPNALEHHLKFLELRRNVHESGNLWVLTVLASLFLPLSLACGILSMQTRLKDLHLLLYDFCGVVVLVVTLAALLILLVKLSMGISGWLKRASSTWFVGVKNLKILFAVLLFQFWGLVIASFAFGMTRDARTGGIILGVGTAYFASVAAIAWVCFRFLWNLFGFRTNNP